MSNHKRDDIFITRMLEETYRFVPERESGKLSTDLLTYYNHQDNLSHADSGLDATSVFNELDLEFVKWEFCESNSCFRFKYNETLLDIPVNWAFCHKIFVAWQSSREIFFSINSQSEDAHFWEVFNLLTPYNSDLVFWVCDQKIYLVLIPEDKQAVLPLLQKKLGLQEEGPMSKAA